jgi:casein kinase II subunit beta
VERAREAERPTRVPSPPSLPPPQRRRVLDHLVLLPQRQRVLLRGARERARKTRRGARARRRAATDQAPPSPPLPPQVDEDYIQDDFNLSGLGSAVPFYDYALDLILDADTPSADALTEEQHELVESAAEVLYGLIHARWVVTARGLAAVLVKHRAGDYGRCPRVACAGAPVLPLGPSDVPRQATVAVFCPACRDAYHPRSRAAAALDGAYFGTTAAHLLLLTHPSARVAAAGGGGGGKPAPRVFGFRVHAASLEPPPPAPGAAPGAVGAGAGADARRR